MGEHLPYLASIIASCSRMILSCSAFFSSGDCCEQRMSILSCRGFQLRLVVTNIACRMGASATCTYLGRALFILIRHASNAFGQRLMGRLATRAGCTRAGMRTIFAAQRVVSSCARFLNFASTPRRLTPTLSPMCDQSHHDWDDWNRAFLLECSFTSLSHVALRPLGEPNGLLPLPR